MATRFTVFSTQPIIKASPTHCPAFGKIVAPFGLIWIINEFIVLITNSLATDSQDDFPLDDIDNAIANSPMDINDQDVQDWEDQSAVSEATVRSTAWHYCALYCLAEAKSFDVYECTHKAVLACEDFSRKTHQ
jgi:hypothetical protein